MVTSYAGYADDIFHVISNIHIQRSKFGGKTDKFGRNSKNSGTLPSSWGWLFPTPGTLGTWWRQGATKCQGKVVVSGQWLMVSWSGLLRESQGPRPC